MKKRVTIYGKLVNPLRIGERALIRQEGQTLLTSNVEHFIEHPNGEKEIITRNTHYTLKKKEAESVCS